MVAAAVVVVVVVVVVLRNSIVMVVVSSRLGNITVCVKLIHVAISGDAVYWEER